MAQSRDPERDIDDELRHHVDQYVRQLRAEGLDADEARRRAEARFGSYAPVRAELVALEERYARRARVGHLLASLAGDLRWAARNLRREPGFAAAVIATVGLAIGASTSLFTLVNEFVLRPVPGIEADRLATVYVTEHGEIEGFSGYSYPTLVDLDARSRSLASLAAFSGRIYTVNTGQSTLLVGGQLVTGNYFSTLQTQPHAGRLLSPADDRPDAGLPVVLSHAFWVDTLGADPDVVGRTLEINGLPTVVVGVAEAGFRGQFIGFPSDIFAPLHAAPRIAPDVDLTARDANSLEVVARLRPGVTLAQAQADIDRVASGLEAEYPQHWQDRGVRLTKWTGLDAGLGRVVLSFVGVLGAIAALVVAIACINVAGLLLHRGQKRRREISVRLALGAGRSTIVRRSLVETLALFAVGQAAGLSVASSAASWLHTFLPTSPVPVQLALEIDWRVWLFATGATLLTALAFGVGPALRATRVDPAETLKPTIGARSPGQLRTRRVLVAAQFAACLVLLVVTGLFARSLSMARSLDTGFSTEGAAIASADLRLGVMQGMNADTFFDDWLDRVRQRPDIQAAALTDSLPLSFVTSTAAVRVDGRDGPNDDHEVALTAVSPGFFETMDIALVAGRDFSEADRADTEPVVILSEATATRLLGDGRAVERHLRQGDSLLRVVGIAGNVAVTQPGDLETLHMYVALSQHDRSGMTLVARSAGQPPLDALRQEARAVNEAIPLVRVQTLADRAGIVFFQFLPFVGPSDPIAFAGAGAVLALVALIAADLPARKAATVDPMETLRSE